MRPAADSATLPVTFIIVHLLESSLFSSFHNSLALLVPSLLNRTSERQNVAQLVLSSTLFSNHVGKFLVSYDNLLQFSYLENLKFLEYLNVGNTHITTETLCKILRRNIRMRHLHTLKIPDQIWNNYRFTVLEHSYMEQYNLTSKGINTLADCKNLRKMYLDWWYYITHIILHFKYRVFFVYLWDDKSNLRSSQQTRIN
ncbi:hypothetical protein ALC53_09317 [Atta colombica]|uniref:Uncharacterized protein n=1 Tax=Atta colombica TaxID=520822 RepID=A0A195B6T2_9HYME|nr:hypothetical protein ALC53_09317 [Atta colombica]